MIKYVLTGLLTVMTLSACSSGPPTKGVIGLPINTVISTKHYPQIILLGGGTKQYKVKHRIEPSPSMESCTPGAKAGDPPNCVSNPGMDGSETTTIYTVDAKEIITDVSQSSEWIPYGSSNSGLNTMKPEEPPAPKYTPEQEESIKDFFSSVHKQ